MSNQWQLISDVKPSRADVYEIDIPGTRIDHFARFDKTWYAYTTSVGTAALETCKSKALHLPGVRWREVQPVIPMTTPTPKPQLILDFTAEADLPTLYTFTGDVLDINTLCIPRLELRKLHAAIKELT